MKGIIMENKDNNVNELEQLKAQYETLKQRFDQQEIVNDRLIKSSIKDSAGYFARYRKTVMIAYPIIAVLGFIYFTYIDHTMALRFAIFSFTKFGTGLSLGICLLIFMAIATVIELWLTRDMSRNVIENSDLLTLSKNMQKLKTGYALYMVFLFLVFYMFLSVILVTREDKTLNIADINTEQFYDAIWYFIAVVVVILVFIVMAYRNFIGHCNNVIQQIYTIEGKPVSRWDKSFRIFLCSIVVAFAACVCIFYSAMCPAVYERPDSDMSTEGKLAIWEVYADTTVSVNDADVFMKQWQDNDSLVVMKSDWVINRQVTIYALKKTTNEGPTISSAVISGKPVVKRIVHESYTKSTPMSVYMTPEAALLWCDLTRKAENLGPFKCALTFDGVVYQDWRVMSGIPNGSFFIFKSWDSKDQLEEFCNQLIKN